MKHSVLVILGIVWSTAVALPCGAGGSCDENTSLPGVARFGPRETRIVRGWTLHVESALMAELPEMTERAVELLTVQLEEIVRVVPEPAVAELQKVPLYFSRQYPNKKPGAEYHQGAGWLKDNGRDPAMAKGVEFTNIRIFEAETRRMPNFTLHELAHAYHDRVLPGKFGNRRVAAAFEKAKASGQYDQVERWFGNGKPNSVERAYGMNNPMEYFAETTEAYFSRNDFFPFNREELQRHDPEMCLLLAELWGADR